jgi:hypothetical protein
MSHKDGVKPIKGAIERASVKIFAMVVASRHLGLVLLHYAACLWSSRHCFSVSLLAFHAQQLNLEH